jgi:two-component system alkaline phosphatase synthesis response regulator PhoP
MMTNAAFSIRAGAIYMSKTKTDKEQNKTPVVLVVDDNQQNRELLQAYLEDVDCRAVPAQDGPEALKIIAKNPPDLILLDVMMPRMSGFEVCRRIKNDPKTSDIPVIMVTALNEFGDIERGIDSGTDDFLSKPVNKLELLTRVKTMLKLKHLTDKLERTLAYLSEIENLAQTADS